MVLAGNSFLCYILYVLSTQCKIQLCGCVRSTSWSANKRREIVFAVTYVLSVQYSCVAGKLILYKFSCWIQISFLYRRVSQKYQDFLLPYSCNHFTKILRTFYSSRKLWIILRRNISNSYVILQKALKILRNNSLWVCGIFW